MTTATEDVAQVGGANAAAIALVTLQVEELDFTTEDYEALEFIGIVDEVVDALVVVRDWAEEALANLVPA